MVIAHQQPRLKERNFKFRKCYNPRIMRSVILSALLICLQSCLFGQLPITTDFKKHLVLNGTDNYINIPANAAMAFSGDVTVEAMIRADSVHLSGQDIIFINCIEPDYWGILLALDDGKPDVDVVINAQYQLISSRKVSPNRTYHIAGVRKADSLFLYIDGILDTVRSIPGGGLRNSSNSISRIGRSQLYQALTYGGCVDELRVWNFAKTQAELFAHKDSTLAGNENGLIAYYQMNDSAIGQNSTIINSATSTGTVLNGTTVGDATTPYISDTCPTIYFFRSRQTGNWNDVNTWESSPSSNFSTGVSSPAFLTPNDYNSYSVFVRRPHIVTVTENVISSTITVDAKADIHVNQGIHLQVVP